MPLEGIPGNNTEARLLSDERFLRKIAYMYYEEGCSQEEIAETTYCSRQTISKGLQRARERGIVRISIVPDVREGYLRNLTREVRVELGLEDLLLIPGSNLNTTSYEDMNEDVADELAKAAAEYLDLMLTNTDVLAVSGGRKIMRNIVRYLKPVRHLPNLQVVATIGFVEARAGTGDANLIAFDVAQAYGAQHVWFCSSAIVPNVELQQASVKFPILQEAYHLMNNASVVVLGLWTPHTNDELLMRGVLTREQLAMIDSYRPVADINHWIFDVQGRCINEMLEPRPYYLTGLEIPRLKDKIQTSNIKVILVAGGGPAYIPAIRAVLRARVANILITDHITAGELLKED